MNVLILNPILYTADDNKIPQVNSIKETMIYGMCLGFMSNGHQVTLITAEEYKPIAVEEYPFKIIFFKSLLKCFFLPSVLPLFSNMYSFLKLHQNKYDLILSSEVFSFTSLFACIICPFKTVIWQELTCHQRKFNQIPSLFWHKIIVPLVIRKAKCIIPRSDKARLFIEHYMKNVSLECVDHGINIENFNFSNKKERQFISSSQLIHRKNVESIIYKYNDLIQLKEYEDFKLLIAGRGELRAFLEKLVEDLNLQDKVLFLGFLTQKELNEVIGRSYAFLVNTRKDLNMVSIPESIVSGTPIITNLEPASASYIIKEQLGIANDDWGVNELIEIIDNNSFYVNNCFHYREKLTNNYCAKKIIDIYHNS